jgi:UDP-N-acetylglucosamine 2-epimerase
LLKKYKKKLLIFTGSRADYGIMSQLIKKIKKKIEVLIFAGADHFEKNFGNTYKEILKDGLNISIKSNLDVLSHSDNLSYYCSKILKEYSSKIKNCNTDAALVL